MSVIEDLSDEEAYLLAIIQDHSGLDLAEFTWLDYEKDDLCWRAWHFQWVWWRSNEAFQVDQSARSIGKSLSIKARAFVFPVLHPGQEMVITAPEGVHLDAITDVIETVFFQNRFGKEMLIAGRTGVKHKPFHMNFRNGARIMGRIPQRDGKGVKGIHPLWLELDEASDYPEAGWTELNETLKRGHEGAVWRAHGVTRGVRDTFYNITSDPNSHWTVHRYAAMWRPTWSDQERQEKIQQYGGRDDPDYRRNLLGLHGDSVSPIFVLHRLMNCVDDDKESAYNQDEYCNLPINEAMLREYDIDILEALDFPILHTARYKTFWIGMDVGYTNHPSEILVFAEERPSASELKTLHALRKAAPPEGLPRLKLITRITLRRIGAPDQFKALKYVINHYNPVAFSMDKTGNGLPLFQLLQEDEDRNPATTIRGYGFSEKLLVDFDTTIDVEEGISKEDLAKEVGIKRNVVEYSTDILRLLVDSKRFWLPWDRELLGEFEGQTYRVTKTTMDQYGKREYSNGEFHALDAARMAVLGWKQHAIEAFMEEPPDDPPILDLPGW